MIVRIHPQTPQQRELERVANILTSGGIVILPTDTRYAFGCVASNRRAYTRMAQIKGLNNRNAHYALVCKDISQMSHYVRPIEKDVYSLLRRLLPGPFTFIMDASPEVPRHALNTNHTIGLRVPANNITGRLAEMIDCPIAVTTVPPDDEDGYLTSPSLIEEYYGHLADCTVDGGEGLAEPSTVIDLSHGGFEIVRQGLGLINEE